MESLLRRLLTKFLNRTATPEETSLFWQWLWRLDVHDQQLQRAPVATGERIWENIQQQLPHPAPRKHRWRGWAAAAAAIVAIATTAVLLREQPEHRPTVYLLRNDSNGPLTYLLPDSTLVTLHARSSLVCEAGYNEQERRATLQGEGYFQVRKDPQRPFSVRTGEVTVRALGTAFNIEAREQETQIRVALTEGKVAVAAGDKESILLPGEMLRYDKSNGIVQTGRFHNEVAAWTKGGISFNGILLTEALDRIAQQYRLSIQYNRKKLAEKTVTASFGKTGWRNVLSSILFPHDLRFRERSPNEIIIY